MFNSNKINHKVTATCSNGNHTATYSFVECYDECWDDVAKQMFYEEFGEYPTSCTRDFYEAI